MPLVDQYSTGMGDSLNVRYIGQPMSMRLINIQNGGVCLHMTPIHVCLFLKGKKGGIWKNIFLSTVPPSKYFNRVIRPPTLKPYQYIMRRYFSKLNKKITLENGNIDFELCRP